MAANYTPGPSSHGQRGSDKLSILFSGRLDNGDELAAALGIDDPRPPAEALLLQGYRRWRKALPEKLLGDFSFVIQDPQERCVFVARDAMGRMPLYYWTRGDVLLCATRLRPLLDHPLVGRRLNHRKLALASILFADSATDDVDTFYEGVSYLPGGSALCLDRKGLRTWSYWRPDPERRLGIPDAEVAEALRVLLFSAVEARLPAHSTPAALLSGGLDSSSITAVAAIALRKQNRALTVFSSVLPSRLLGELADERAYIRELACFDNIAFVDIADESTGPFDAIDDLIADSGTPLNASRHYLYSSFAQAARARGATSILDGCFGELGPTHHGQRFYPELLRSGQWMTLARELVQRARMRRASVWRVAASEALGPLSPRWMARALGRNPSRRSGAGHALAQAYLDRTLGASQRRIASAVDEYFRIGGDHRTHQARAISLAQRRPAGPFVWETKHGVDIHYPFLDKRVIEFCLAAPGRLKIKDGYPRSLVRHALAGILPPKIQWRTSKQPFSPDYHLRYNRQRPQAEAMLSGIGPRDPIRGIVDIDGLREMARREMGTNRCDTPSDFAAMHIVPQGIYLIAFLRQFPEFKAS